MSEKNDRIFIGGADDVYEVIKSDKVDIIFDLRAEANMYFWEKYESILNS